MADNTFVLDHMFPDPASIFSFSVKPLHEIKASCLVSLDTNVLLAPYELDSNSISEIKVIYEKLAKEKRLILSAQVAREYAKNRSTKVAELVHALDGHSSRASAPVERIVEFLGASKDFGDVQKLASELKDINKKFQGAVRIAIDRLTHSADGDPVLQFYRDLFPKLIVVLNLDEKQKEEFSKDLKFRYENKIAPGYQDSGKPTNSAGDLILWKTLLEVGASQKKDLLLVTGETKNDWFVKRNKQPFQPKFELIDEYRRKSGGHSFHMITLAGLLRLFEAKQEAISAAEAVEDKARLEVELSSDDERASIQNRLKELDYEEVRLVSSLKQVPFDPNENLSLPWNRAAHGLRHQIATIQQQRSILLKRLADLSS